MKEETPQHEAPRDPKKSWSFFGARDWRLCVCAIALYQLGIVLLNSSIFPLFSGVMLEARDIATLTGVAADVFLYWLAVTRPSRIKPRAMAVASLVLVGIGAPLSAVFALMGNPVLLVAASCLRSFGTAWIGALVCLPLVGIVMRHGPRAALACLCLGWALSYGFEAWASVMTLPAQIVVFSLAPLGAVGLSYRSSRAVIDRTLSASPARELRVTNPASFLPLGHSAFIILIMLKMSFGFAMTFASVDAEPLATVLACIPALLIACCLLFLSKSGLELNNFYRATMLCVLAGFLLVNPLIVDVTGMPALANVVLRAGSDLTRMFTFLLIAFIGARNPMNALSVSLYLGAANSLGSVVGAQLGIAANSALTYDPGLFSLLLAAIVFVFVAYNMLAPHSFDFDRTASLIQAVEEPQAVAPSDTIALTAARLAAERSLTPREAEALELLAHGRNTQAIQDRMVVSRSTAKTHVRNVYAKLGVHSQQDLIDMVEKASQR